MTPRTPLLYGATDDKEEAKSHDTQKTVIAIDQAIKDVTKGIENILTQFSSKAANKTKGLFGTGLFSDSYDKCAESSIKDADIFSKIVKLQRLTEQNISLINKTDALKKLFSGLLLQATSFPNSFSRKKEEAAEINGIYGVALETKTTQLIDSIKEKITHICLKVRLNLCQIMLLQD